MNTPPRLITLGVVAEMLGMSKNKAQYYLQTRRIDPIGIAGHANVYDKGAILALRDSLKPKAE